MCEQCRANAAKASGIAAKEVERVSQELQTLLNRDAEQRYESGNPPHPFAHAEALVENALVLASVPLISSIEDGNMEEKQSAMEIMEQAEVFQHSIEQALALVGTTQGVPTMAGIIGMLSAAKGLLEGFHPEIEVDMKQHSTTAPGDDMADLLKNFMKVNGN